MATFTRNSTAYLQNGTLVNTNLPRYEPSRIAGARWRDTFDVDQISTHYTSGGDVPATWTVSNGVLSATGGGQATLLRTGLTIADGEIIANLDQAGNGGLIARHVDNNNYYLLVLSDDLGASPTNNIRVVRRIAGVFTDIAGANVTWTRGTAAQIRFRFNGSLLEAWFNGVSVIAATDTTFTSGGVGMRNNHAEATRFLDFAVHQVTPSIFPEEGVTNLLTANQASVETDLTGLISHIGGTTLTRDTSVAWQGSASIRIVTDGAQSFQGIMSDVLIPVAHSQTYTFSAWVRGSGNIDLIIQEFTAAGVFIAGPHSSMRANSAWTRHSVTCTFGATGERIRVLILTNPAQAVTFWADGLQLEQRPYATSWQLPGTPRAGEVLTIPTAGVFNRGNWSVEGTYTPQIPMNVGGTFKTLFDMRIDANNWYVFGVGGSGEWHLRVDSGGIPRAVGSANNVVLQGIPYHWQISGNGTTLRLCVNGVLIGETTYTEPVGTIPANMFIGSEGGTFAWANGFIDDLRISRRARTLAEHQAVFNSGLPADIDNDTTALHRLNNTLFSAGAGYGGLTAITSVTQSAIAARFLRNGLSAIEVVPSFILVTALSNVYEHFSSLFATGHLDCISQISYNYDAGRVPAFIAPVAGRVFSYRVIGNSAFVVAFSGEVVISRLETNEFRFAGIPSSRYYVKMLRSPISVLPGTRDKIITIPGRHGTIRMPHDWQERTIQLECWLAASNMQELHDRLDIIRAWLGQGQQKLTLGYMPDRFYIATFVGGALEAETKAHQGLFSLEFVCADPFAHDIVPDVITITAASHQHNQRGTAPAKPLLVLRGQILAGQQIGITIGVRTVVYSGLLATNEQLEIDCDTMSAFRVVSALRTNVISQIATAAFPVLEPGLNTITITPAGGATWSQLEIQCRNRWL